MFAMLGPVITQSADRLPFMLGSVVVAGAVTYVALVYRGRAPKTAR